MALAVDTDEKVARFRREVLPRLVEKFRPSRVLVFGSRARGDALKHSDLDVLIVAEGFAGIRWLDRAFRVYQDCDIRVGVELLCYTPEEYARKVEELGIVRTATVEGVDLLGGPPMRVAEPRRPGPERVRAWLAQAGRDMEAAEVARRSGHHEWACFAAQQGADGVVTPRGYSPVPGPDAECEAPGAGPVTFVVERLADLRQHLRHLREIAPRVPDAEALRAAREPPGVPECSDSRVPFQLFGAQKQQRLGTVSWNGTSTSRSTTIAYWRHSPGWTPSSRVLLT